jgi:hypothetical protein
VCGKCDSAGGKMCDDLSGCWHEEYVNMSVHECKGVGLCYVCLGMSRDI